MTKRPSPPPLLSRHGGIRKPSIFSPTKLRTLSSSTASTLNMSNTHRGRGRSRALLSSRSRSSSAFPDDQDNLVSSDPRAHNRRSVGSLSQLSRSSSNNSELSLNKHLNTALSLSHPGSRGFTSSGSLTRETSQSSSFDVSPFGFWPPPTWQPALSPGENDHDIPDPSDYIDDTLVNFHNLTKAQISSLRELARVSPLFVFDIFFYCSHIFSSVVVCTKGT